MIFEVTFCIVFILASRAIAKIYYRRRDVLDRTALLHAIVDLRPTSGAVKDFINGIPLGGGGSSIWGPPSD